VTALNGRVICLQCDIDDVEAAHPDLRRLYQVHHRDGQFVMQVGVLERPPLDSSMLGFTESSEAHRWTSIAGLADRIHVRAPDEILRQLTSEENLNKRFAMGGLLRPTRTYDVVSLAYLDPTPDPLAFSRQAQEAAQRAEAAAKRAEAAAARVAGATERAENALDRLAAMSSTAEEQFTANLTK
jgi:hypothetical protein